jgi:hypothetical protein
MFAFIPPCAKLVFCCKACNASVKTAGSGPPKHLANGMPALVLQVEISTGDAGEIGDLAGGGADAGEEREPVGTDRLVLRVHQHLVEKGVDRNA